MFRMISKERLCEGSLDEVSLIAVDPSSSALTSLVTTEGGLENTINDEPPASNVAELSVRDQRQQRHQLVRDLTNFETGRAKSLRGELLQTHLHLRACALLLEAHSLVGAKQLEAMLQSTVDAEEAYAAALGNLRCDLDTASATAIGDNNDSSASRSSQLETALSARRSKTQPPPGAAAAGGFSGATGGNWRDLRNQRRQSLSNSISSSTTTTTKTTTAARTARTARRKSLFSMSPIEAVKEVVKGNSSGAIKASPSREAVEEAWKATVPSNMKAFVEGRSLSVGQAHSSVAAHAAACLLEASAMVAGTQELLDELCTNGVLALEEVEDANEDAVAAFASFVGASLLAEQEATSHRGGIDGDGDEQQGLFATATATATAGALAKATATTTGEGTAASDSATEDLTLPPAPTPVPVPSAATTTKTAVEVVSSPAAQLWLCEANYRSCVGKCQQVWALEVMMAATKNSDETKKNEKKKTVCTTAVPSQNVPPPPLRQLFRRVVEHEERRRLRTRALVDSLAKISHGTTTQVLSTAQQIKDGQVISGTKDVNGAEKAETEEHSVTVLLRRLSLDIQRLSSTSNKQEATARGGSNRGGRKNPRSKIGGRSSGEISRRVSGGNSANAADGGGGGGGADNANSSRQEILPASFSRFDSGLSNDSSLGDDDNNDDDNDGDDDNDDDENIDDDDDDDNDAKNDGDNGDGNVDGDNDNGENTAPVVLAPHMVPLKSGLASPLLLHCAVVERKKLPISSSAASPLASMFSQFLGSASSSIFGNSSSSGGSTLNASSNSSLKPHSTTPTSTSASVLAPPPSPSLPSPRLALLKEGVWVPCLAVVTLDKHLHLFDLDNAQNPTGIHPSSSSSSLASPSSSAAATPSATIPSTSAAGIGASSLSSMSFSSLPSNSFFAKVTGGGSSSSSSNIINNVNNPSSIGDADTNPTHPLLPTVSEAIAQLTGLSPLAVSPLVVGVPGHINSTRQPSSNSSNSTSGVDVCLVPTLTLHTDRCNLSVLATATATPSTTKAAATTAGPLGAAAAATPNTPTKGSAAAAAASASTQNHNDSDDDYSAVLVVEEIEQGGTADAAGILLRHPQYSPLVDGDIGASRAEAVVAAVSGKGAATPEVAAAAGTTTPPPATPAAANQQPAIIQTAMLRCSSVCAAGEWRSALVRSGATEEKRREKY